MKVSPKHIVLALTLVIFGGIFFFFYLMYQKDVAALGNFKSSYEKFDQKISDLSARGTDDVARKANEARVELNANTSFSLSSLIKNDNALPVVALEIADLSGKELDALDSYTKAMHSKSANLEALSKAYDDLRNKRKAAYARFEELAEIKD